jgi:hypothetical protein
LGYKTIFDLLSCIIALPYISAIESAKFVIIIINIS